MLFAVCISLFLLHKTMLMITTQSPPNKCDAGPRGWRLLNEFLPFRYFPQVFVIQVKPLQYKVSRLRQCKIRVLNYYVENKARQ